MITKSQLVKLAAHRLDKTQSDVSQTLDVVLDLLIEELKKGNAVHLPPVGKFEIRQRNQRIGRNIKTGKSVLVPAHNALAFVANHSLKHALKGTL